MCDQQECYSEKMTCDPCLVEGKKEKPQHFCVNCLEYFCITCAKYHRKYKQSRDHTILDDLPKNTSIYEKIQKFSRCLLHPEIEIDKFCKQHDAMICRYCFKDKHSTCENVVYIDECQQGNTEAIPGKLVEIKTKYSTQKTILAKQLEELQVNNSEVENNIKEFVQQIRDVADRVERSLNENHKSLVSPPFEAIRQRIERIGENEKKYNECKTFYDIMSKNCSEKDQYILVCKLNELLNDSVLQENLQAGASPHARMVTPVHRQELFERLLECEVKLCINEELVQENCSDEDINSAFCNVHANADELKTAESEKIIQVHDNVLDCGTDKSIQGKEHLFYSQIGDTVKAVENQLDDNYPFLKMIFGNKDKVFDIHRTDKIETGACNIVTLDVLSDGRIILIDDGQNVLKLFSAELTFISFMSLTHEPTDMCVVEENGDTTFTVAVCFEGRNYIRIIEHSMDFKTAKNIQCKGTILSLTMFVPDILVLAYDKNRRNTHHIIQVIQPTSGHIRFVFNVPRLMATKAGSGICMHDLLKIRSCTAARRIILAADNEIYVFIFSKGNSVEERFRKSLQCDWFYQRSGNIYLTSVTDVKTDLLGNIYICDLKSGIHQVSAKSHKDRRILFPNIGEVSSMVIDMPRRRIFLCHANTSLASVFLMQ